MVNETEVDAFLKLPCFLHDPMCVSVCVCVSCLVMSDSLQPHRLKPTMPLCPWDSPGKNTGVEWVAISFSKRNYRKKESEVAQSCLTLCNPMDCSLPGSSIHGIFQARVLEWVAISFSSMIQSMLEILISGSSAFCKPRL